MWFKQLTAYPMPKKPEKKQLDEMLGGSWFGPCLGLDWFAEGFTQPTPYTDMAVADADGHYLVALKREEKVLPSAAIKEILEEKINNIKNAEGRDVGSKEKRELKEKIIDDLLPRALTRSSRTHAILTDGWLLIDNAAPNKAEKMLAKLREALGGLEAKQPVTRQSPSSLMTNWLLAGEAQGNFKIGSDIVLRGSGDIAPVIKIKDKDLTDNDVVQHARNGMTVAEMNLQWHGLDFVLTDKMTLKSIKYLDVLTELPERDGCDGYNFWYTSQIIMTRYLTDMLTELLGYLGGWNQQ
ncbi:recombination-associated protein RdgC [Neisseria montereyensis]|uniref:Recombination-associated protein RdgC n=1 Tax=Neisseria montereyensis TaxID=2973938 RepID=A0ABT2FDL6_9NEIS|nr:recombination-associated protein RdgC [Neisseria montereyensis]MCS4534266.1 recombination-associated protein RdgC [Neisseria montereyensis]